MVGRCLPDLSEFSVTRGTHTAQDLYIAPSVLPAGANFTVTVRATPRANAGIFGQASVRVHVEPSNLVAIVSGGSRTVAVGSDLVLDGTDSYDPDDLLLETDDFQFEWTCRGSWACDMITGVGSFVIVTPEEDACSSLDTHRLRFLECNGICTVREQCTEIPVELSAPIITLDTGLLTTHACIGTSSTKVACWGVAATAGGICDLDPFTNGSGECPEGCFFTLATCDLDAATDHTATCPAGCELYSSAIGETLEFTMQVWRPLFVSENSRTVERRKAAEMTVDISIIEPFAPAVSLSLPGVRKGIDVDPQRELMIQGWVDEELLATAELLGTEVSEVHSFSKTRWALLAGDLVDPVDVYATEVAGVPRLIIPAGELTPGQAYQVRLYASSNYTANATADVLNYSPDSFADISFSVGFYPRGGTMNVWEMVDGSLTKMNHNDRTAGGGVLSTFQVSAPYCSMWTARRLA